MYQFEDDDIQLEEINHKYTLLSDPTLDFISCTEYSGPQKWDNMLR